MNPIAQPSGHDRNASGERPEYLSKDLRGHGHRAVLDGFSLVVVPFGRRPQNQITRMPLRPRCYDFQPVPLDESQIHVVESLVNRLAEHFAAGFDRHTRQRALDEVRECADV